LFFFFLPAWYAQRPTTCGGKMKSQKKIEIEMPFIFRFKRVNNFLEIVDIPVNQTG
jgi:hypothetical protein